MTAADQFRDDVGDERDAVFSGRPFLRDGDLHATHIALGRRRSFGKQARRASPRGGRARVAAVPSLPRLRRTFRRSRYGKVENARDAGRLSQFYPRTFPLTRACAPSRGR
ncbi:hypothetical protein WPS_32930 [Vulcanimicrobium alpinum]|uniref:Uncharacterized protein n=1 Tax=Vulcanimicrobium alpinum TaxID=3016050 RepID=A0AAN1Y0R3_UNVUL|nr:hypothetical protein WPS_32930 [Vulcanimicrobium alpinum]